METLITKEMVAEAMKKYGTVQKAATALGLRYPAMQKLLRRYGIVANHNAKEMKPVDTGRNDDEHSFRVAVNNWYKRFFKKGE